jgi:tetratricopeptide (TPR) repeat protein
VAMTGSRGRCIATSRRKPGCLRYLGRDQERFLLDVLLSLNSCERSGFPDGEAHGCSGFGIICDVIPALSRLAPRYHARAIALAERVRHPVTLGLAYLGATIYEYYAGHWDRAHEHAQRAMTAYTEAGELRQRGALTDFLGTLHAYRGEYLVLQGHARELLQVGQDAADSHVLGWGLRLKGLLESRTGRLDRAANAFREAIELFRSIPAYPSTAEAIGDLAECYLFMGNWEQAIDILEDCRNLIALHGLRGHQITSPRNALAEAYCNAADHTKGSLRDTALKRAQGACDVAVKQGRIFRGGLPHALRVSGSVEWLKGKETAARASWNRSLKAADQLGSRYDLAMTHIEIGKRLDDGEELQRGADILAEIEGSFKRERA